MNHIYVFFATGFWSGYAPKAPGTAGSLVAALLIVWISHLVPEYHYTSVLLAMIVAFFAIGVFTAHQLEKSLGKDPSCIVIDEFVGMWISILFLPSTWWVVGLGFVLFRFFDILKPFFIKTIDSKVGGGWGVMLDDVLAGIYANICLQCIVRIIG